MNRSRMRGFSLIESLVALLILSLGLFSVAMMTNRSVLFSDGAAANSQAIDLAYELADRARTNSTAFGAYAAGPEENVDPVDCTTTACSPAELAQSDLADWKRRIAALLPQGQGGATIDGDTLTITVQWKLRTEVLSYVLVLGA